MDRYIVPTAVTSKATTNKQQTNKKPTQTKNKHKQATKTKKTTAQGESVIGWPVQQRRAMNEGVIALFNPIWVWL